MSGVRYSVAVAASTSKNARRGSRQVRGRCPARGRVTGGYEGVARPASVLELSSLTLYLTRQQND